MAKGLHSLIRLHKWQVDERRRVLGALLAREEELLEQARQMELELAREQEVAKHDVLAARNFDAYLKAFIERRERLQRQTALVRDEILLAREDLAEAFRTLKTYELTQKAREKREREEADRREQANLDEVAANLHRRQTQ
jgi:flagellar export protein FliJ